MAVSASTGVKRLAFYLIRGVGTFAFCWLVFWAANPPTFGDDAFLCVVLAVALMSAPVLLVAVADVVLWVIDGFKGGRAMGIEDGGYAAGMANVHSASADYLGAGVNDGPPPKMTFTIGGKTLLVMDIAADPMISVPEGVTVDEAAKGVFEALEGRLRWLAEQARGR